MLCVNGVNVENVEHAFVIRLLKEAKDFIHLVIKRPISNHTNNTDIMMQSSSNINGTNNINNLEKRHNLAIQQTAATVMSNYTNQIQNPNNNNTNQKTQMLNTQQQRNLMTQMMNSTTSISSLKPMKVTLNKKEKKDVFGLVLGCKYYIKEILPDSLAFAESNLRKGDIVLKLNDLTCEQFSLNEANKILSKSKDSKLNIVVKRNSITDELEAQFVQQEVTNKQEINENPEPVMGPPSQAQSTPNAPVVPTQPQQLPQQTRVKSIAEPNMDNCDSSQQQSSSTPATSSSSSIIKQLFKPIKILILMINVDLNFSQSMTHITLLFFLISHLISIPFLVKRQF